MNEHNAPQPQALEFQLMQIGKTLEGLQHTFQQSKSEGRPTTSDSLGHLAQRIMNLAKQVAKHDEHRRNLSALANIGQVVNSSLHLNEVLKIVMDTIIQLTGAERGFLMLRDQDGAMKIRIARNWEKESIQSSEYEISRTVVNRVVDEGLPIVTTNAQEDPRFDSHESIIAYSLRSILCVPLKGKEKLTGVIYADNRIRTGIFTETNRDLLAAFANQAAVAIENAQLFESVRETLDEVTNLKNLMDNIFASIASGVITADTEEKITLCNQAAERILGKTAEDLLGRCLDDCVPPLFEGLSASISEVRITNQPVLGLEMKTVLPERGAVDLVFNLSPLKDSTQNTQGIAIVLDDHTEKNRLEAQRKLFERMVPPAVIHQIDLNKIQLGGERTKITTLFADVRGFTRFSESLPPERLVSILNLYLAAAAEAVLAQEGTLDKFMGDAVMALFNAPIPQKDHTLRAVRAALSIQHALRGVHQKLPTEYHLGFGIGIHFGDAVLGLIGTEKRVDYTAIGDSVNTAKRIQENAAAGQILISKDAYTNVKDAVCIKNVPPIHAKGKKEPIEVFEILDLQ